MVQQQVPRAYSPNIYTVYTNHCQANTLIELQVTFSGSHPFPEGILTRITVATLTETLRVGLFSIAGKVQTIALLPAFSKDRVKNSTILFKLTCPISFFCRYVSN